MALKNIYVNQQLTLTLDTLTDLSTAVSFEVRLKSPAGTVTSVDATQVGSTSAITCFIAGGVLSTAGNWSINPMVVFDNDPYPVPGVTLTLKVLAL